MRIKRSQSSKLNTFLDLLLCIEIIVEEVNAIVNYVKYMSSADRVDQYSLT